MAVARNRKIKRKASSSLETNMMINLLKKVESPSMMSKTSTAKNSTKRKSRY